MRCLLQSVLQQSRIGSEQPLYSKVLSIQLHYTTERGIRTQLQKCIGKGENGSFSLCLAPWFYQPRRTGVMNHTNMSVSGITWPSLNKIFAHFLLLWQCFSTGVMNHTNTSVQGITWPSLNKIFAHFLLLWQCFSIGGMHSTAGTQRVVWLYVTVFWNHDVFHNSILKVLIPLLKLFKCI